MGETLTEQRRVKEEVIRYVNFCHRGRTVDIGNDIQVTVLYKKATANYVPADSYVGLAFTTIDEVVDYIKEHSVVTTSDTEEGRR